MTTYVLVHGAWHGPWAWDRIVPLLHAAGARALTPNLGTPGDHGLHDDARTVLAALDAVPADDDVVLVGHSYAGLVVREAADQARRAVDHIVLVDGWAGPDGTSLFALAPETFAGAMRAAAAASPDGRLVPAPPPHLFGIVDATDAARLAARLVPQPLRTFSEATRLSGRVDRIPGTAVHCRPQAFAFDRFGRALGYRTRALDGPHDIMLTDPEPLARLLLDIRRTGDPTVQDQEARSLE
ncbi:alpha/beta hydrolase family protein [Streptomyces sp. NPDC006197]|uniref:alpha/beta hydrolase family protein n=1 Tax=Streptomyces sp. NPDC006197 TaxID=3156685 RepID=UPI0033A06925